MYACYGLDDTESFFDEGNKKARAGWESSNERPEKDRPTMGPDVLKVVCDV